VDCHAHVVVVVVVVVVVASSSQEAHTKRAHADWYVKKKEINDPPTHTQKKEIRSSLGTRESARDAHSFSDKKERRNALAPLAPW
jgi:hypothetical protein